MTPMTTVTALRAVHEFHESLDGLTEDRRKQISDAFYVAVMAIVGQPAPGFNDRPDMVPTEDAHEPYASTETVPIRPIQVGDKLIFPGGVLGIIDAIDGHTIRGHRVSDQSKLEASILTCRLAKSPT